jgi:hypothetical protein
MNIVKCNYYPRQGGSLISEAIHVSPVREILWPEGHPGEPHPLSLKHQTIHVLNLR